MPIVNLESQLLRDEGEVLHAYRDSLGYWTIGVGHLIDVRKGGGISKEISALILADDIKKKSAELEKALPWISRLSPARRGVLQNMAFQMGVSGVQQFTDTLKALSVGNWLEASRCMLRSKWAGQTPERALRLANQIIQDRWQ